MAQNLTQGRSNKKQHYLTKWVLYLSVPQVIFGVICIICQTVLIEHKTELHFVGQGIWAGLVVCIIFFFFFAIVLLSTSHSYMVFHLSKFVSINMISTYTGKVWMMVMMMCEDSRSVDNTF